MQHHFRELLLLLQVITYLLDLRVNQQMIMYILGLEACPQADAADALAIAVCHAHTQQVLIKVAGASSSRRGRLR